MTFDCVCVFSLSTTLSLSHLSIDSIVFAFIFIKIGAIMNSFISFFFTFSQQLFFRDSCSFYSPNVVPLPAWKMTSTSGIYGLPIEIINANASANKHEPNRSPNAVKIGIAELSGSILYFHITWIITCAMYNSVQIWNLMREKKITIELTI